MEALLEVGLGNAAMAGVLAVGVALLAWGTKRPALAHALWLVVLAKLLTPPIWTVGVPMPWGSAREEPVVYEIVSTSALPEPSPEASVVETPAASGLSVSWQAWVGRVWLAGSLVWLASAFGRIGRFQRVLRMASPAPADLQEWVDGLARRVGLERAPGVWVVPGAVSPLVWALAGPPRLLIPRDLWETLDDDQRDTLLIHELAHLRRRDHWVRWVELAATALYWWCPVAWWARRQLREAEEQCCDAWVVWACPWAKKAYANALLDTVDFLAATRPSVPLAASGAGHVLHLKRRLTMILRGLTPKTLSPAGRAAVLGLAALLLPLAPSWATDEPKPAEPTKPIVVVDGQKIDVFGKVKVDVADAVSEVTENVAVFAFSDDEDDDKDKKDGEKKDAKKTTVKVDARNVPARVLYRTEGKAGEPQNVRFYTSRVQQDSKASPEDKAALEKARAELKDAQEAVGKAAKRLAEAQRKIAASGAAHGPVQFDIVVADPTNPNGQVRVHKVIPKDADPATVQKIHAEIRAQVDQARAQADQARAHAEKARAEGRAEATKARAEAEKARKELRIERRVEAKDGEKPKTTVRVMTTDGEKKAETGDADSRLKALEKKLEVLSGELKALKSKKD
jgi:bla regulator protein BlaR1